MANSFRILAGSKFRVSMYSVVLAFAAGTVITSSIFQDMYDWPVGSYPKAAAVLLAGSGVYVLTAPVLHYFFHRKRPSSLISSPLVEKVWLSVLFVPLLVGSILTCALQHQTYETDPYVPDIAISLEVLGWFTTVGVLLLIVSAFIRSKHVDEKHERLSDEASTTEMV
ncbi:hypothetical protein JCM5350_007397 [Sporobolomyces pararoseus]